MLDSKKSPRFVVGQEDYQLLVEDPEILARPALICIGEGGSWDDSYLLSDSDVVAVGRELEAGVLGERSLTIRTRSITRPAAAWAATSVSQGSLAVVRGRNFLPSRNAANASRS